MPLSAELAKLVGLIQDPAEREARRKELTELSEGSLRQSDYSRRMNELAEQRKSQEAQHNKNLQWFEKANKEYDDAQRELREANERVSALESAKGSADTTLIEEAEIRKQLKIAEQAATDAKKKADMLTETVTGFNKMIEEGKLVTPEKLQEELNKGADALGVTMFKVFDLQSEHMKEYGVPLDRNALLTKTQELHGDLDAAYRVVSEEARIAKLRKDIEAETEKRWVEKQRAGGLPIAGGEAPTLGPLQTRIQKKDTGIPDDVQADGSGRLSGLIAEELRAEGKG